MQLTSHRSSCEVDALELEPGELTLTAPNGPTRWTWKGIRGDLTDVLTLAEESGQRRVPRAVRTSSAA